MCFITDLDEIWNPEIDYSYIDNVSIYKLKQLVYSLYLNNRSNESWAGTTLVRYGAIKNACLNHIRNVQKTKYVYIESGGWHFTFMGGSNQIKLKLEALSRFSIVNGELVCGGSNNVQPLPIL